MSTRPRFTALRAAILALAAGAMFTTGGCVTVPMGSEEVATMQGPGVDLAILIKARRDPILILESEFDEYSTWAVNRGPGDTCLGFRPAEGSPVSDRWIVPAGQELKLYDGRRIGGSFTAHAGVTDPTCTSWN